ncbi:DofB protein [Myxococcaceae bacterium GXIMD 01537]
MTVSTNVITRVDTIDRIFFSRWDSPPDKDALAAIEKRMADAVSRIGQPLIYLASVGGSTKLPDAQERANLNALLGVIRKYCDVCYLTFEGPELQANLQRVIMSGVIILTRTYDNFLKVVKGADSIADELTTRLGKDARPIIAEARSRGLVA